MSGDFHDNGVCPNCGHCKHCGRGPAWPYWMTPYYPQPTWVWPGSTIVVGGGNATNVIPSNITYTVTQ